MTQPDSAGPLVVVMGVCGCGKTAVGSRLAVKLGVRFVDGDDLHPPANVAKMAGGTPLTDLDRGPWLLAVGRTLREHSQTGLVVACSALRRSYRDVIRSEAPETVFVHLRGDDDVLHARMAARSSHFMQTPLLAGQLRTLEPLHTSEPGYTIDIDAPLNAVVDDALSALR